LDKFILSTDAKTIFKSCCALLLLIIVLLTWLYPCEFKSLFYNDRSVGISNWNLNAQGSMGTIPRKSAEKYAEVTLLFRAGLDGDRVAYEQFLQKITPLLRAVVCRKLPFQDTEDVVQEILISIHKARHTYDGERPLMP
jgi:hypothetical protein